MPRILSAVRLELALFLVLILGILIGNREAVQIGFRSLYVVEAVTALVGVTIAIKLAAVPSVRESLLARRDPALIPVVAVLVLGAVQLLRGDLTTYAVRQSVINFYAVFALVFVYAFTRYDLLVRFLYASLCVGSLFIGAKLFWYTIHGIGYREESFRVLHNEVDVIAIPIALIGLLVCRKALWQVHRGLYGVLMVATVFALVAPFKRTSYIALALCGGVYLLVVGKQLRARQVLGVAAAGLAIPATAWAGLALLRPGLLTELNAFVASKFDIFNEGNASWRWLAWGVAWQKFREAPLLGSGFGQQILDTRVWYVDTADPHNSYLAFLVHNGLVGGLALLAVLVISGVKYLKLLRTWRGRPGFELVLFYFLSWVFVLFFPLFNVMLENQYQGIFFWFFVAGPHYLGHVLTMGSPEAPYTTRERTVDRAAGVVLLAYAVAIVSPYNFTKVIEVYSPSARGQMPSVYESVDEPFAPVRDVLAKRIRTEVSADAKDDGIAVSVAKQPGLAGLTWVLPHIYRIYRVRNLADYALVVEFSGLPGFTPLFTLRTTAHASRTVRATVQGQTVRVWLKDYMADDFLADPSEAKFCIELPTEAFTGNFTITNVSIRHKEAL